MKRKALSEFQVLTESVLNFRDERNWKQFHNAKDLAVALNLEASELLEIFLWKDKKELQKLLKDKREELSDEICDVLHLVLLLSHELDIDIMSEFERKMEKNRKKYPLEKVKGKNKKYTEY